MLCFAKCVRCKTIKSFQLFDDVEVSSKVMNTKIDGFFIVFDCYLQDKKYRCLDTCLNLDVLICLVFNMCTCMYINNQLYCVKKKKKIRTYILY